MVWIRVGTAVPEDVLEQRDVKGLLQRQKAYMLHDHLEHSNISLSLVCLIMQLIPTQQSVRGHDVIIPQASAWWDGKTQHSPHLGGSIHKTKRKKTF